MMQGKRGSERNHSDPLFSERNDDPRYAADDPLSCRRKSCGERCRRFLVWQRRGLERREGVDW